MLHEIKIVRLPGNEDLSLPEKMTETAAGFDLKAAVEEDYDLLPGDWALISTGIAIEMPGRLEAQVRPRSGLAFKHGITMLNAPGTIDSDYRGEIKVILHNLGSQSYCVTRGERIAQLVFLELPRVAFKEVTALSSTVRGSGGFGHTGQ